MNTSLEVESKYRVFNADTVGQLLEIEQLGSFVIGPRRRIETLDTYFDTAESAFAKAGYAFRHRQRRPGADEVTLKTLSSASDGRHRRSEITQTEPPEPLQPASWPAGIAREQAEAVLQGGVLRPLFSIEQTRHVAPVRCEGQTVAEVSLDEVRWVAGERVDTAWVLEFELAPGQSDEMLDAIAADLDPAWSLAPEMKSKYELGLELVASALPAPTQRSVLPQVRIHDFVHGIVRQQMGKLTRKYESLVAGQDAEAVHDARVAARRMRSALYFFGPWLPAKITRQLRRRLGEAGRTLGAVRDLDVTLAYVHEQAERIAPIAEQPLSAYLQRQRQAARKEMLAFLDGPGYRQLRTVARQFLHHAPAGKRRGGDARHGGSARRGGDTHLREVLPPLLRQAATDVYRFDGAVGNEAPIEHLHELRIAVKRQRYLLEFSRMLAGASSDALIKQLAAMQDLLGNLHDADVAHKLAYSLLRNSDIDLRPDERQALLVFGAALAHVGDDLRTAFYPLWDVWVGDAMRAQSEAIIQQLAE